MKKGKEIGKFSFKAVTFRVLPHGRTEVNIEGTATGFKLIVQTVNSNPNGGPYSSDGVAVTDSGETVYGHAEGVSERLSDSKYRTTGVVRLANGRTTCSEGEIDWPNRTWIGKVYEATE